MKLREKFKRLWTMDVHNHEGFTLVELIIVIAILAILSGVAVAGYSAYIKKANKQADLTMLAEIKNAIMLAYYADQDFEYGALSLAPNADATTSSDSIAAAMQAAFGSNWAQILRLKTNDWDNSAYVGSSFAGQEMALIGKVDSLTDVLSEFLSANPNMVGTGFREFLETLQIDPTDSDAVADAAVLYVAQTSAENANRQAILDVMINLPQYDAMGAATALVGPFGGSYVAAAAGLYAVAQAYCQYENALGNPKPLEILNNSDISTDGIAPGNEIQAVIAVFDAFAAVGGEVVTDPDKYHMSDYFSAEGQVVQDTNAYLDMMKTVNDAQEEIAKNTDFGAENAFSNSEVLNNMFMAVAEGGILVYAREDENGSFVVEFSCELN